MPDEYGWIKITQTRNIDGLLESIHYEWIGAPVTKISYNFSLALLRRDGNVVMIGPYKMLLIEEERFTFSLTCVRLDYPFWWFFVFAHHWSKTIRIIYARFIITLAVWRLAEFHEGAVPSFKDIYLVQKLIKLFSRKT